MASSSGRLVHFRAYFDRFFTISLYIYFFPTQFPGCLQACQFFQNADLPQKDPVMPTSAEPSVQLVGNLATWPRPSERSSNSKREKERLVYAVIQKQSSGRWRQIIQVGIVTQSHCCSPLFFFFTSNSSSSKPFRIYLYDGLCLR